MGDLVKVRCEHGNTNGPGGRHWAEAGDVVEMPDAESRAYLAIPDGGFSIVHEDEVTEPAPAEEITEPAPRPRGRARVEE